MCDLRRITFQITLLSDAIGVFFLSLHVQLGAVKPHWETVCVELTYSKGEKRIARNQANIHSSR